MLRSVVPAAPVAEDQGRSPPRADVAPLARRGGSGPPLEAEAETRGSGRTFKVAAWMGPRPRPGSSSRSAEAAIAGTRRRHWEFPVASTLPGRRAGPFGLSGVPLTPRGGHRAYKASGPSDQKFALIEFRASTLEGGFHDPLHHSVALYYPLTSAACWLVGGARLSPKPSRSSRLVGVVGVRRSC